MCVERSYALQAAAGSSRRVAAMTGWPAQSASAGGNSYWPAQERTQPGSAQARPLPARDDIFCKDCYWSEIGRDDNGRISGLPVNLRARELLQFCVGRARAGHSPLPASRLYVLHGLQLVVICGTLSRIVKTIRRETRNTIQNFRRKPGESERITCKTVSRHGVYYVNTLNRKACGNMHLQSKRACAPMPKNSARTSRSTASPVCCMILTTRNIRRRRSIPSSATRDRPRRLVGVDPRPEADHRLAEARRLHLDLAKAEAIQSFRREQDARVYRFRIVDAGAEGGTDDPEGRRLVTGHDRDASSAPDTAPQLGAEGDLVGAGRAPAGGDGRRDRSLLHVQGRGVDGAPADLDGLVEDPVGNGCDIG